MTAKIAESTVYESGPQSAYGRCWGPWGYDLSIGAIFLPLGGIRRLRSVALDLLDLRPGMRVLDLGCGTGGVTNLLLSRGALVTGVDGSEQMLARAKRRAPDATFVCSMLEDFEPTSCYDRILFAFVLHELSAPSRHAALALAQRAVASDGLVAILDWAVPPTGGLLSRAWRWFLLKLEPPSVIDCLAGSYETELASHQLQFVDKRLLANGTAQLVLARPSH
jgi:demethylmenaquinone methyltransferase/2-methoxy-6-polyprenyl-1,4-benzoquinol methylase